MFKNLRLSLSIEAAGLYTTQVDGKGKDIISALMQRQRDTQYITSYSQFIGFNF